MKNLKIFVSLNIMILGCASLQAQFNHAFEMTPNVFCRLSTFKYKAGKTEWCDGSGSGGGLDLGYRYFFTNKRIQSIGLLTGVETAFYEATYEAKILNTALVNSGQYESAADEATILEQYEMKKQRLWMFQVPVMLHITINLSDKSDAKVFKNFPHYSQFLEVALGCKFGFPLKGDYDLIRENKVFNSETQSYTMDIHSKQNSWTYFTYMPSLEISYGLIWFNTDSYNIEHRYNTNSYMRACIAFYFDHGIPQKTNNSLYTPSQTGILAHQPDYDDPLNPLQQVFVPNDAPRYAVAFGIKLKFTFGISGKL
jgi:hypothetical protein